MHIRISQPERAKLYRATHEILAVDGDPTTRDEAERTGWCAAISLFDIFEIANLLTVARALEDLFDETAEVGCVAYVTDRDLTRALWRCSFRASTAAMLSGLCPDDGIAHGRIWIEPGTGPRQQIDLSTRRWDGRQFVERSAPKPDPKRG